MSSTISSDAETDVRSTEQGPDRRKPWIYGPWVDLVIGCGAWSAPLPLGTYAFSGATKSWSFAFYFLALLFNYPHFMATVYRAHHSYDEFAKYRFFTVHVLVLLACAGLLTHLWYPLLPWVFTLYICWSPWHYTGQNLSTDGSVCATAGCRQPRLVSGAQSRNGVLTPQIASRSRWD